MRYALRIEFDGSQFCGWQEQRADMEKKIPSVQQTIQRALKKLLGTRKNFLVWGCGRTDSGVHAEEYVAHVDIPDEFKKSFKGESRRLRLGLNSVLPRRICIKDVAEVDEAFDALDSVTTKVYEYRILIKMTKPALDFGRIYWIPAEADQSEKFDLELLRKKMKILEGEKDFAAFASSGHTAKTTVRRIHRVSCEDELLGSARGRLVKIQFEGEGFLKQQVRNMVGALVAVATKKRPEDFVEKVLAMSDGPKTRIPSLFCAPAEGLYLVRVNYDRPVFPAEKKS
jgi:tRNA pseudouridine38-40 synthase